MTHNEYETVCLNNGLDPTFPIQHGKRYKVTGWRIDSAPTHMRVYVSKVNTDTIDVYATLPNGSPYRHIWDKAIASKWTWTEED